MPTLTVKERAALEFIVRTGGGLEGGRQNTLTMQRLVNKGLARWTGGPTRIEATPAGLAEMES